MLTRHIVTQSLWPRTVGGKDGDGGQFQVGPSPQVTGRDRRSGQEDNWEETNGVLGQWPRQGDILAPCAPGHHPKGECVSPEKQKMVHNHTEIVHIELRCIEIVKTNIF